MDACKPWEPRKYRYLLYSVVASRASPDRGTLWYPFQASRTIFFFPGGTVLTRLNREGVWCVSRLVTTFWFCKSIVLRGLPSFWGTVIILEHHVVGVPAVTGSIILSATFASSCDLTASFRWWGTGIGLCTATGWQLFKNEIESGSLVMVCNFWWVHGVECTVSKITFKPVFQLAIFRRVGEWVMSLVLEGKWLGGVTTWC